MYGSACVWSWEQGPLDCNIIRPYYRSFLYNHAKQVQSLSLQFLELSIAPSSLANALWVIRVLELTVAVQAWWAMIIFGKMIYIVSVCAQTCGNTKWKPSAFGMKNQQAILPSKALKICNCVEFFYGGALLQGYDVSFFIWFFSLLLFLYWM